MIQNQNIRNLSKQGKYHIKEKNELFRVIALCSTPFVPKL